MSSLSKILLGACRQHQYFRIASLHLRPLVVLKQCNLPQFRLYSNENKSLSEARQDAEVSTDVRPLGEKIKENTKTVSYLGVILIGVGVAGVIFYYVFEELFSSSSANAIYSAALDRCIDDPRVSDALGAPIKGFGEETTRRRRTRVSHAYYMRDDRKCIRMQFYIRGTRGEGTVQLDMIQRDDGSKKFEYRYMLVQLNDYTRRVIILEDNRSETDKKSSDTQSLLPNIL